jgi:hypothetical protein
MKPQKLLLIAILFIIILNIKSQDTINVSYEVFKVNLLSHESNLSSQHTYELNLIQKKIDRAEFIALITCASAILYYAYAPESYGKTSAYYLGGVIGISSLNYINVNRFVRQYKTISDI